MQASSDNSTYTCHDCGSPVTHNFCPVCGQKRQPLQQPVHHFVRDAVVELAGVDGRLWRTLKVLMFQPGRLTAAYRSGQRTRYLRPLRVYLTSTLLFFFLLSLVDPAGKLERQLNEAGREDTTALASVRYDVINTRMRDDSLESRRFLERVVAFEKLVDSLRAVVGPSGAVGPADDLEEANEDLAEARRRFESAKQNHQLRRRRFLWQQQMISTYPPDSLIRPDDLAKASLYVVPGDEAPRRATTSLPDWMIRNPALRRLQESESSADRMNAGAAFLRGILNRLPAAMFILLPVFALLLKPLYSKDRVRRLLRPARWLVARMMGRPTREEVSTQHFYNEHLVFALHTHAFAFAVFTLVMLWNAMAGGGQVATLGSLALFAVIPIYGIVAQQHVYREGWLKTLFKFTILSCIYGFLLLVVGLTLAFVLAAALG